MKKKNGLFAVLTLMLTIAMSIPVFAGSWQKVKADSALTGLGYAEEQWQYVEDDGSYKVNEWAFIDGNWYYFSTYGFPMTGLRSIGDNRYYFLSSGVLETNRDYGFATIDENGVYTLAETSPKTDETYNNVYADYCRTFGVDIDYYIQEIGERKSFIYRCAMDKFPKDSSGKIFRLGVDNCISAAVRYDNDYWNKGLVPADYFEDARSSHDNEYIMKCLYLGGGEPVVNIVK